MLQNFLHSLKHVKFIKLLISHLIGRPQFVNIKKEKKCIPECKVGSAFWGLKRFGPNVFLLNINGIFSLPLKGKLSHAYHSFYNAKCCLYALRCINWNIILALSLYRTQPKSVLKSNIFFNTLNFYKKKKIPLQKSSFNSINEILNEPSFKAQLTN